VVVFCGSSVERLSGVWSQHSLETRVGEHQTWDSPHRNGNAWIKDHLLVHITDGLVWRRPLPIDIGILRPYNIHFTPWHLDEAKRPLSTIIEARTQLVARVEESVSAFSEKL
jgi:hypothetical protein